MGFASIAHAADPAAAPAVTPASTPTTVPSSQSAAQQGQTNKMKVCAQQYHQQNIPKSQYRSFMSTCLKKDSSSGATPASATAPAAPATNPAVTKASTSGAQTQKDKMKSCNTQAKTQGLSGDTRKTFMKSCLSN